MATAHFVKKARKDNPAVKAGESYYWWKFKGSPKQYSATRPTLSQVTRSYFLSTVYSFAERLGDLQPQHGAEIVAAEIEEVKADAEQLLEETQESFDNIPEQLQEGHMLEERLDNMRDFVDALEHINTEGEDVQEMIDEAQAVGYEGM